jgi:hypothetical protein
MGQVAARRVNEFNQSRLRAGELVDFFGALTVGGGPSTRSEAIGACAELSRTREISRGLVAGRSLRAIAVQLGRAPSTISREVARNGGADRYRATLSDAGWLKHSFRTTTSIACHTRRSIRACISRPLWRPQERTAQASSRQAHDPPLAPRQPASATGWARSRMRYRSANGPLASRIAPCPGTGRATSSRARGAMSRRWQFPCARPWPGSRNAIGCRVRRVRLDRLPRTRAWEADSGFRFG